VGAYAPCPPVREEIASAAVTTRRPALFAAAVPPLFVAIVAILTAHEWDYLHRIGWKLWGKTDVPWPSGTALGSWGGLQVLNFVLLGSALLAVAIGTRLTIPRTRAATIGVWSLGLAGLAGLALAFKTDPGASTTTWHGRIHVVAFVVLVVAMIVALVSLSQSLWPLRRVSLVGGLATLALLVVSSAWSAGSTVVGGIAFLVMLGWIELAALQVRA
jgi:hypothetical protein